MALPPGVVALNPGEPCPPRSLCLYRDANFSGPAYAVGEGYDVDLNDLPCEGGAWGPTMAGNVSSWNNRTEMAAKLVDKDGKETTLARGDTLTGGPTEDKIVKITWVSS